MQLGSYMGALGVLGLLVLSPASVEGYVPDPWERQVMASCLILEASSDGPIGLMAVANVISNRADGNPKNYYKVIKKRYAFSSMNAATLGRTGGQGFAPLVRKASRDPNWALSLKVVDRLYAGELEDMTKGATHFSLKRERESWMSQMKVTAIIGSHKFMKEP